MIEDGPLDYLCLVHRHYHYGVATVPRIPFGLTGATKNVEEVETATTVGFRVTLVFGFGCRLLVQRYPIVVILGASSYIGNTPFQVAVHRAVSAHYRCGLLMLSNNNNRPILTDRPLR